MRQTLVITDADRRRLGSLLHSEQTQAMAPWTQLDKLLWLLESCEATDPKLIPDSVVTMHSAVRLVSESSGAIKDCVVVYPEDVELFDNALSVLEPLGATLIGCGVGDSIDYERAGKTERWRIADISYQPEREGDFHR